MSARELTEPIDGIVSADDGFPRFSSAEMQRRRDLLSMAMAERGIRHAVVYGANRFGSAVGWLTGWPVTREALAVYTPGERDTLFVNFYNHVPNAERLAINADVRWAGPSIAESATDELRRRGGAGRSVGVIGPVGFGLHGRLADAAQEVVDMNPHYFRMRMRKSDEELEWLKVGVRLTDLGVDALCAELRPGLSEHELANTVERAYVPRGGRTHIHYFGVTPMSSPSIGVPAQWTAERRVQAGDVVSCEISASYWDYTGQLLRTFAVAEEPTALYRELHRVADAAFDAIAARLRPGATAAEVVEAASVIEDAGFTTRDDLVHGFVGAYLPPVLGSPSRQLTRIPDFRFDAGMTVVVQPNVVTQDETAGVQTGELLLVGHKGVERLHAVERGLRVV